MDINIDNTQTSLNISEDVIRTIANEVIKELPSIYSLSNLPAKLSLLTTPATAKPVKIAFVSDSAHVDVGVIVNMNYKIKDVAEHLQSAIKDSIQDMTGITVSKVNIYVTGVHVDNEDK
ncbi:MAG: Asp23/Gls24 family envelope stress response protein [Oscillospiraceae bacterium]